MRLVQSEWQRHASVRDNFLNVLEGRCARPTTDSGTESGVNVIGGMGCAGARVWGTNHTPGMV
jgi:hypothetical protein